MIRDQSFVAVLSTLTVFLEERKSVEIHNNKSSGTNEAKLLGAQPNKEFQALYVKMKFTLSRDSFWWSSVFQAVCGVTGYKEAFFIKVFSRLNMRYIMIFQRICFYIRGCAPHQLSHKERPHWESFSKNSFIPLITNTVTQQVSVTWLCYYSNKKYIANYRCKEQTISTRKIH